MINLRISFIFLQPSGKKNQSDNFFIPNWTKCQKGSFVVMINTDCTLNDVNNKNIDRLVEK